MKKIFCCLFLWLSCLVAQAEVHLIAYPNITNQQGFIPTVYWPKDNSTAVLIFLPGGNGSFGVTQRNPPKPFWLFADLHSSPDAKFDIVFMDSNFSLQADTGDAYSRWAARRETSHFERIKKTVEFYKSKTGKPVFLLGHSNGSLSVAEFLNDSRDNQKMLGGVIFSGSRNETEVKQQLSLPSLVLHHKLDPNRWTTPLSAEKLFVSIQQTNASITQQGWVVGGQDILGGDPAHSGRHMYFEATAEAANMVQKFLNQVVDLAAD
jgi:pimeloyl-ACP methyl ester carboxylesterase